MIILIFPYGNHSNRLIQTVHIEALCKEYGIKYWNPSFYDMANTYGIEVNSHFCKIFILLVRPLVKLRLFRRCIFSLEGKNEVYRNYLLERKNSVVFVGGFRFRCFDLTQRYKEYFRERYSVKKLTKEYYNVLHIMESYDLSVGIHVRRGDYKKHQKGKYFYNDDVYRKHILRFSELNNYKNILFIIFSDEAVNESTLIPEKVQYIVSRNPYHIDHSLMSNCDYLIGPPSTFTLWASYMGGVNYYHIEDPTKQMDMEDFKISLG